MPAFGTGLLFFLLACTDGGEKQETGNPETGTTDTQDTDTDTALEEDADGDGYLSYAHGGEDCDDQDATVFPGAPEVLADARDNDCDGRQDLLDFAEANARLIEQNPDEGGGYSVAGAAGFGGVGVDFLMVSAPYGKEGGDDAGTVYLFGGEPEGLQMLTEAQVRLLGEEGSEAGKAIAGGGDTDRDGFGEILVGGYHGADGAGVTWLIEGPLEGTSDLADAPLRIVGEFALDFSACAVDFAGDVDGDGDGDIVVGAYHQSQLEPGAYQGAAYLVHTPASGTVSLADATKLEGESSGDEAGYAVAGAGDVNGDGLADLLIGARYQSDFADYAGAAYLVFGPVGDMDLADADARWMGEGEGDYAGSSLASAGDVDGDGSADLLVGARQHDGNGSRSGAAYLVLGSEAGSLADAHARLLGEAADDRAGYSVAAVEDFDGDGRADLLVGAIRESSLAGGGGAAYLVLGVPSGTVELSEAAGKVVSSMSQSQAGTSVAGLPDLDGDGGSEFLVGSLWGEAYLFYSSGT